MASLDQSATYSISFQGGVDPHLIDMYGPLCTEETQDEDGRAITILHNFIADQAAIVGIVRTLHGMGIVVLSVQRGVEQGARDREEKSHVSHVIETL